MKTHLHTSPIVVKMPEMLFGIICGLVCHFLLENIGSEMFLGFVVKCPVGSLIFCVCWLCILDNKISKVLIYDIHVKLCG